MGALGAVLLWCASSVGAAPAVATDLVEPVPVPRLALEQEAQIPLMGRSVYWMDPTGGSTIEQVAAGATTPPWRTRQHEHGRLQGGALWIAFEAVAPTREHWYLEVGASLYDKVQLYHRDRTGAWIVQDAGSRLAVSDWAVPGRLPTFALATDDPAPVRYWLRLEDERADFSAPLTLFREDALQASREQEQFLFGVYLGLAGLVATAAIVIGGAFRDKAMLAFAMYIVLLAAGQLGRTGVGAQHVWPQWNVWNTVVLGLWPGVATAAALWFVKVLTDPARLSRALDLAVSALTAALLAAVALDLAIATRMSMTLVLALTTLSLVAIFGMLMWGWMDGRDRYVRLVAVGFLPVMVLALFPLARVFGLIPASALTRFGLFFGAALELPIIYYALNLRLMARREGELRASALSRTDALTGLPHRQALIDRLDSSLAHARGQKQHCALLGVRISNLDAIAEEFGREAAEKSLVVAASHLRRCTVGYDMAARVGEREFAVLLEAPVTPPVASSRAQQIVASGLRQMEALPAALTLKFQVTVALLPDPQMDGAASLDWVVGALDGFTPDTRKLIKPLNL